MKGDFTRFTFDRKKHYSGIRMQQGRVQLDSDWNELVDIQSYRMRTESEDFIGPSGAPKLAAGFGIGVTGDSKNLTISKGRIYVDGILCENETTVLTTDQPDLPGVDLPESSGLYLAYLEVWHRHITALEDPSLREVALGGPDTATRIKTVWQVKLLRVGEAGTTAEAESDFPQWTELIEPSAGELMARVKDQAATQVRTGLYRVEVHDVSADDLVVKWARDNVSSVARCESLSQDQLTVASQNQAASMDFRVGQWIELITDRRELRGEPGELVQVKEVQGDQLTLASEPVVGAEEEPTQFKVLRWDSKKTVTKDQWETEPGKSESIDIDLGDGIEIQLRRGFFRTGDYWLIPTRSFNRGIEWPNGVPQPPHGIERHYCQLALVNRLDDGTFEVNEEDDRRFLFSSLNAIRAISALEAGDNAPDGTIYVDNGGNVGIGTTSPGTKLEVFGATTVSGNLDVTGKLTVIGDATVASRDIDADGAALDTHLARRDNPHNVTLKQLGAAAEADLTTHVQETGNVHALTLETLRSLGVAADADLDAHVGERGNVHGLTLETLRSLGVAADADLDAHVGERGNVHGLTLETLQSLGVAADANLTTHTGAEDNPHNVTAEQALAASSASNLAISKNLTVTGRVYGNSLGLFGQGGIELDTSGYRAFIRHHPLPNTLIIESNGDTDVRENFPEGEPTRGCGTGNIHFNVARGTKLNPAGPGASYTAMSINSNGEVWAKTRTGHGFDYAEYFESSTRKEIPAGTSVTLERDKIRPARKGEEPFGVISATPGIVGGVHIEWPKKYLRDEFEHPIMERYEEEIKLPKRRKVTRSRQKVERKTTEKEITRTEIVQKGKKYLQRQITETVTQEVKEPISEEVNLYDEVGKNVIGKHRVPIMETYEEEVDVLDDDGNPVLVGTGKFETKTRPKLNPEYDESQEYIPREQRPEWNCVGLLGKLPLRKGQPVADTWVKLKDLSEDVELWLVK